MSKNRVKYQRSFSDFDRVFGHVFRPILATLKNRSGSGLILQDLGFWGIDLYDGAHQGGGRNFGYEFWFLFFLGSGPRNMGGREKFIESKSWGLGGVRPCKVRI